MLILYPRISNGNILWSCDDCKDKKQVVYGGTNAVALVCQCDGKTHPKCNSDWYYKGLYWERIPMKARSKYSRDRYKKK